MPQCQNENPSRKGRLDRSRRQKRPVALAQVFEQHYRFSWFGNEENQSLVAKKKRIRSFWRFPNAKSEERRVSFRAPGRCRGCATLSLFGASSAVASAPGMPRPRPAGSYELVNPWMLAIPLPSLAETKSWPPKDELTRSHAIILGTRWPIVLLCVFSVAQRGWKGGWVRC